jgi:cyclin-dependent kinase 8/11
MPPYRSKVRVLEKYQIIGFISSGTYGRVYKARSKTPGNKKEFAIKKCVFLHISSVSTNFP